MTTTLRLQLSREYPQEELCKLVEIESRLKMEAEHAAWDIYASAVRPVGGTESCPSICLEAAPVAA